MAGNGLSDRNWRHAIRRILVVLLAVLTATAVAATGTGWSEGTPAARAPAWFAGMPGDTHMELPDALARKVRGPTLLVYFSPTCPHCQAAQPELNELAKRMEGKGTVIGVASGSSREASVAVYKTEYDVPYELVWDGDREIGSAMAVRSTPSALLVDRNKDGLFVVDGWYPYQIGGATLVMMRLQKDPWAAFEPGRYHGNATCAACHVQETESWQLTHHSIAWHTLVQDNETENAECTSCHVTGAGKPTGWAGQPHSPLVDVGCEACHGPGGPHDGQPTEARSTCEGCHDAKHSIAFSFEKGVPHIDHFRANGMDEMEWVRIRRSLADGTAERSLLAFPDGEQVGAAACKECHEAQYAWWEASDHGKAMASLQAEKAQKHTPHAEQALECVRCHATAKRSGAPAPTSIDDYHATKGVECESCHGPGQAHIASKGAPDTIEGLGDDCPVCVLEAVCTRCHTEAWDPLWNLDQRLPAIAH